MLISNLLAWMVIVGAFIYLCRPTYTFCCTWELLTNNPTNFPRNVANFLIFWYKIYILTYLSRVLHRLLISTYYLHNMFNPLYQHSSKVVLFRENVMGTKAKMWHASLSSQNYVPASIFISNTELKHNYNCCMWLT